MYTRTCSRSWRSPAKYTVSRCPTKTNWRTSSWSHQRGTASTKELARGERTRSVQPVDQLREECTQEPDLPTAAWADRGRERNWESRARRWNIMCRARLYLLSRLTLICSPTSSLHSLELQACLKNMEGNSSLEVHWAKETWWATHRTQRSLLVNKTTSLPLAALRGEAPTQCPLSVASMWVTIAKVESMVSEEPWAPAPHQALKSTTWATSCTIAPTINSNCRLKLPNRPCKRWENV